MFVRED
jgi:hypothetical protein